MDAPRTRSPFRLFLGPALVTLLLAVVFVVAAYAHARTQNADVGRFDQDLYLQGARALHDSAYAVPTNRLHMPVYLYFQAFFYDSALPMEATFTRARVANVALALALLAVLHAFFRRTLPIREARLLTLIFAFTIFVFRAPYVQVECLFYVLAFFGFVGLCSLWERPSWKVAIVAGAFEAAAHLTKGSVLPGIALFTLAYAVREALFAYRARRVDRDRLLARTTPLAALLATYLGLLAPYLRTSKALFGAYFFAAGPSYAMWMDSWDEWVDKERRLGSYTTWHLLPKELVPSAANYLHSHSIGQIVSRELLGLGEMLGNTLLSHGYIDYAILFLAFAGALAVANARQKASPAPFAVERAPAFAVVYLAFYVFLFAFYGPIAAGNRFILTLFLPALYAVFRAHAPSQDAYVSVFGYRITWHSLVSFATALIALHIAFRLPATITRIAAGG